LLQAGNKQTCLLHFSICYDRVSRNTLAPGMIPSYTAGLAPSIWLMEKLA